MKNSDTFPSLFFPILPTFSINYNYFINAFIEESTDITVE